MTARKVRADAADEKEPKARRTYGSGSVYQRSDGRWIGSVYDGWSASGARHKRVVSAKTETELRRKLKDLLRDIAKSDGSQSLSRAKTVKSYADEWLEQKGRRLAPNTMDDYRSVCKKWIVPTLGHKRLNALTPADLRKLETAHEAAGNSTTSAHNTHAVFRAMLKAATVEGYEVPARLLIMEKPPVADHDREALKTLEAVAVLAVSKELPHGSRWLAALLAGLRQGEALGLTWDNVNLDDGVLYVSWKLQTLRYLDRYANPPTFKVPRKYEAIRLCGAWHLTRPKSKAGWRVVPLVPWMVDALRAWRDVCPESPYGLVWPRPNGRPADAKDDRAEWWSLQGTANVGHPAGRYYTLHEARNTTATLLMEVKAGSEAITAILGHSSYETSRGYMHVSQTVKRDALDGVAARLQLGA